MTEVQKWSEYLPIIEVVPGNYCLGLMADYIIQFWMNCKENNIGRNNPSPFPTQSQEREVSPEVVGGEVEETGKVEESWTEDIAAGRDRDRPFNPNMYKHIIMRWCSDSIRGLSRSLELKVTSD